MSIAHFFVTNQASLIINKYMDNLSPEELIALASIVSINLSNNLTKKQLIKYKTFLQTIVSNLQAIIVDKIDKN